MLVLTYLLRSWAQRVARAIGHSARLDNDFISKSAANLGIFYERNKLFPLFFIKKCDFFAWKGYLGLIFLNFILFCTQNRAIRANGGGFTTGWREGVVWAALYNILRYVYARLIYYCYLFVTWRAGWFRRVDWRSGQGWLAERAGLSKSSPYGNCPFP